MSSLDISLEYTLKGNEKAHDCRGIIYNTPTSTFNTKTNYVDTETDKGNVWIKSQWIVYNFIHISPSEMA